MSESLAMIENMPASFASKVDSAFAALVFIGPKSKRWRIIKSALAQFPHVDSEGDFLVLFDKTKADLAVLTQTLLDVSSWKTAYLLINGKRVNKGDAFQWLSCFSDSLEAGTPETYCPDDVRCWHYRHALTKTCDPNHYVSFIVPCKLTGTYVHFSDSVPASFNEQFEHEAIERGDTNCPNFGLLPFKGPFIHKDEQTVTSVTLELDAEKLKQRRQASIAPKQKMKTWVKVLIAFFAFSILAALFG